MKKFITGISMATGIAVLATAFIAGAQTTTSTPPSQPTATESAHLTQMILQVGPAGRALLRGTVDSVSNGSLVVKSWGGDWTVNVGSAAEVLPAAAGSDLSQFKAGDFVGVQGTVSQSANWTIDATLVRDWTYRRAVNQERKQNIQSVRQTMRSETPRNYAGVASNVSGASFTLTVNGAADTVTIASDARVMNRNWLTMQPSSIQDGDNVRVWGVNASGTITAQIVRDVSLPAAPAKKTRGQ